MQHVMDRPNRLESYFFPTLFVKFVKVLFLAKTETELAFGKLTSQAKKIKRLDLLWIQHFSLFTFAF